jgi:hypothetical protein
MTCDSRCRRGNPKHKCQCVCQGVNHGIEYQGDDTLLRHEARKKRSERQKLQGGGPSIGTRVKALKALSGVPEGTIGVVDEDYGKGVMVAWDLQKKPLPAGWEDFERDRSRFRRTEWPLRDGFDKKEELDLLEVLS